MKMLCRPSVPTRHPAIGRVMNMLWVLAHILGCTGDAADVGPEEVD